MKRNFVFIIFTMVLYAACDGRNQSQITQKQDLTMNKAEVKKENLDTITFGAGCFWCVEAIFQELNGVYSVASGYSGGGTPNPTYEEVCSGSTGHAEVCQVLYDPDVIRFEELLEVFWQTHDPTTLNRQGADIGTPYRSVIFYHTPEQKELAGSYKQKLNEAGAFDKPVITEIEPFKTFYKAENYHQDYFNLNSEKPYCQVVIGPKLEKFRKVFGEKIRKF
jgi:peptide-methionine (S)-S-oxide reductase